MKHMTIFILSLLAFLWLLAGLASMADAESRPDPSTCPDLQAGVATLFFPAGTQTSGTTVVFSQTICGQPVITTGLQDSWGGVGVTIALNPVSNAGFGLVGHLDYAAPPAGHTVLVHWQAVQATQP